MTIKINALHPSDSPHLPHPIHHRPSKRPPFPRPKFSTSPSPFTLQ
ncbi:MAG: hypothetical protein LBH04_11360 [Tannerellaceae bacterium]|nr:hypothetical protein [Tannerellaceae bacterium]